jgi:AraC-like DNA-binding protein
VFSQFEIFARELAFRSKTDVQVSNLVKSLCAQPLRTTLHHELGKTNLGRRRLEQRFLESVGISIGSFLKKTRFQLATRLLSSEKTESKLNSLVHEMEYYDQSHFIHEFKQFAGYTPGEYIKNKNGLLDFLGSLTKPSTA